MTPTIFSQRSESSILSSLATGPIAPPQTVIHQGVSDRHTYRIPTVCTAGDGTVLAFLEGRRESIHDECTIDVVLVRSHDHGQTWSAPQVLISGGTQNWRFAGNPCPLVIPDTGMLILLFTTDNQQLWVVRSADHGHTWSEPTNLDHVRDAFPYATVRIATGPGHGLCMRNGRLIAPVWLSDRLRGDQDRDDTPIRHRAGIVYSDDGGDTWSAGGLVPATVPRLHECTAVETPSGELYLNMRARGAGYRATALSSDQGCTWTPAKLDTDLPCPTCHAAALNVTPSLVAFTNPAVTHDKLYSGPHRRHLTLRWSTDGGVTWIGSRVIEPGIASYSDLTLTTDHHLLCLYETGDHTYHERIVCVRIPLGAS